MRPTKRLVAVVLALVLTGLCIAVAPAAGAGATSPSTLRCFLRNNNTVPKLLECVTLHGVLEHERAFQFIADRNGGNRASGTRGYNASVAYVVLRMKLAGYRVTTQQFDFNQFSVVGPSVLQQTAPGSVTYVENTDFIPTPHSEPGDVTRAVTPVDLQLGLGNGSTSGCEASDFTGFPAGNIALIQRGVCTFELKAENAAAAGASGVLFFNQGNTADPSRQGIPAVTLGNGYTGGIPALSTTYAIGADLSALPGLQMRLFSNVSRIRSVTYNVFAESRHGDPNNVIMAGAHLDSVNAGPGINDNGSGSSALLEVAEGLARFNGPNQLRFAWWGAEEGGLVGSTHYVTSLTPDQRADIEMYLNFDMVGSPNYGLFIYDGDGSGFGLVGPDGSDEIEATFEQYYAEIGQQTEPTAFDGRSDYLAFIQNGIPAGGLFTGAEQPKTAAQVAKWGGTAGIAYDPCYHQACDTINNVSHQALDINSDAMAYTVFRYAAGIDVLND
jgi:Zn-dependent M28 family amino/carboxypeptidase